MPGRLLVIAYNFPPVGGIGTHRTLKYASYLPRWGWQPVVVTARNPGQQPWDVEAERQLPAGLDVERALSPEPVKLRRLLGRALRLGRRPRAAATGPGSAPSGETTAPPGRRGRLRGAATAAWTGAVRLAFFPDQQMAWAPFAARSGLRVHRREPVDAIYSSSGPISCHVAAGWIAGRTGLPWVADFRDPWIGNAFAAPLPRWQRPFQRRLERWVVERADRVVFVSEGVLEGYRVRYPWAAGKLAVIPNGYDREDFSPELRAAIEARRSGGQGAAHRASAAKTSQAGGRYRMAYAGAIYGEHELETFLDGLELLLSRRPELRDRLEVEFIGALNVHNTEVAARYASPDRLGSVVRYTGFLPHAQALARLAGADALFNIIGDSPEKRRIPSGKLSEYVGLDRQIVAFVPEGSARQLLRELDWGIVADPTPEGVARGIEQAIATPAPARAADPEGRYDRVNLARRLAALIDEVVAEHGRRR